MTEYTRRIVDNELDELLEHLPAVLLDGARAVGKTESALRRATTVWRLDDPADHEVFVADMSRALAAPSPVLVDEWHRVPTSWDAVKRAVDTDRSGGRILLTGSAALATAGRHPGSGRISVVRLRPMTLTERANVAPTVSLRHLLADAMHDIGGSSDLRLGDYTDLILGSGFPGLQNLSGRALRSELDGYVELIVERDFREAGATVRKPQLLMQWLRAYASATATTATWQTVRSAATPGQGDKPPRSTTEAYVELLTALRVLDEVPGWLPTSNRLHRLTAASKLHLVDPALSARLLNVKADDLLLPGTTGTTPRDGPLLGRLFESLATLSVRVFAQTAEARLAHLRTKQGRQEVDLIVEGSGGRVVAIEVKLAPTVTDVDVRHLHWLRDQIGDDLVNAVVLTTGTHAYRRSDGVAVVPLALLGP